MDRFTWLVKMTIREQQEKLLRRGTAKTRARALKDAQIATLMMAAPMQSILQIETTVTEFVAAQGEQK